MPVPPALLWIASVIPVDRCDACRGEGSMVQLCAPHSEAERRALEQHAAAATGTDAERAKSALESLAALTATHDNAASERVAAALARGLEHGDVGVRRVALKLLATGQHSGTARSAVLEAARRFPADALAYRKAIEKLRARSEKRAKDGRPGGADAEAIRKALEDMSKDVAAITAAATEQAGHAELGIELVEALADGDDAELDALLRLADALNDSWFLRERLVAALLLQRRQDAVARAVDVLEAWEESLREAQKELAKLERERSEQERRAGDDPAERLALAANSRPLHAQRARVETLEQAGRSIHDAFAAGVRARGLGDGPEWNGSPHKAWKAWFARNREKLPRRIDETPSEG